LEAAEVDEEEDWCSVFFECDDEGLDVKDEKLNSLNAGCLRLLLVFFVDTLTDILLGGFLLSESVLFAASESLVP